MINQSIKIYIAPIQDPYSEAPTSLPVIFNFMLYSIRTAVHAAIHCNCFKVE